MDLIERRETRIPNGLRMIAAKCPHEFGEPGVRDEGEMRSGMAGFRHPPAPALEERDLRPRLFEQLRGRDPGDARTDDYYIHVNIRVEFRERRGFGAFEPKRSGVHNVSEAAPTRGH